MIFLIWSEDLNAIAFQRFDKTAIIANLAEAWRKRLYQAAFIAKLSDSEDEAAEVQVWLKFAVKCGYLDIEQGRQLYAQYNQILASLVTMIKDPKNWLL